MERMKEDSDLCTNGILLSKILCSNQQHFSTTLVSKNENFLHFFEFDTCKGQDIGLYIHAQ